MKFKQRSGISDDPSCNPSPPLIILANLYPTDARPAFGTFVKNSADALEEIGWRIRVIHPSDNRQVLVRYTSFYIRSFFQLLRMHGVVYVHYVSLSAPPALAARVLNRKLTVVLHYHGSDAFPEIGEHSVKGHFKHLINTLANRVAALVVAPSSYFMGKLRNRFSLSGTHCFVSPSGGYDERIFFSPIKKRSAADNIIRVMFAGRMIAGKGAETAAHIAVKVSRHFQTFRRLHWTFIGEGPQKDATVAILGPLIESRSCAIHSSLPQADLAQHFREADFVLFPSHREGESLGLVVVEAMACRAIPLALRHGAIPELLEGPHLERITCAEPAQLEELLVRAIQLSSSERTEIADALQVRARAFERKVVAEALSDRLRQVHRG